jgi:hypothetical protein
MATAPTTAAAKLTPMRVLKGIVVWGPKQTHAGPGELCYLTAEDAAAFKADGIVADVPKPAKASE